MHYVNNIIGLFILFVASSNVAQAEIGIASDSLLTFVEQHCVDCHDSETTEGGLDLSSPLHELEDPQVYATWVKVHDRVLAGEMPPDEALTSEETRPFTDTAAKELLRADRLRIKQEGRATVRRLNRIEYEYTIRDLLGAPWLQLANQLPEDGTAHGFNRSGEALDVAHVHLARYLDAADYALNETIAAQSPVQTKIQRFYAREQEYFLRGMNPGGPPSRHPFPVLDGKADHRFVPLLEELNTMEKRKGRHLSLLNAKKTPEERELEAVGVIVSTYEPTEIRFGDFKALSAGKYRLKLKAYSIWVGSKQIHVEANPAYGLMEDADRLFPDFTQVSVGRTVEPVTLYSDRTPRILRRLGSLDVTSEPTTQSIEVWLQAGETIRPDAARLFRPRGSYPINPLATEEGMPGVAFQWMEIEGPLAMSPQPLLDKAATTEQLIRHFLNRSYRRKVTDQDVHRFVQMVDSLEASGSSHDVAILSGYKAILTSPGFLYLHEQPGELDNHALASRLSYFLTNSAPDDRLRELADQGKLSNRATLRKETERLLKGATSWRFVNSFLDYWLDLRHISSTSPDGSLYPDYQLDDLLTESMTEETRQFFRYLISEDLPARNLVASDFLILNERMATHYGLSDVRGVDFRKVDLPSGSVRGGLMTQASVLKVTSDGTTTSPILRGAWIAERILGLRIPPPPENVGAVEPDTRGANTIRKILDKHRNIESCAICHRKIDPFGFALEGFDVMGAERNYYRAVGGDPIEGGGHNGRPFEFHDALEAGSYGVLQSGESFQDVRELKQLLLRQEQQIASNFLEKLIVYATGAPVGFADRKELKSMLNRAAESQYGIQTLICEVVQSKMFRHK